MNAAVARVLHGIVFIALGLIGLVFGTHFGFESGGWIGGVAMGAAGLLAGLFIASGPSGWLLVLQALLAFR
jgi:hypothetical protein